MSRFLQKSLTSSLSDLLASQPLVTGLLAVSLGVNHDTTFLALRVPQVFASMFLTLVLGNALLKNASATILDAPWPLLKLSLALCLGSLVLLSCSHKVALLLHLVGALSLLQRLSSPVTRNSS